MTDEEKNLVVNFEVEYDVYVDIPESEIREGDVIYDNESIVSQ